MASPSCYAMASKGCLTWKVTQHCADVKVRFNAERRQQKQRLTSHQAGSTVGCRSEIALKICGKQDPAHITCLCPCLRKRTPHICHHRHVSCRPENAQIISHLSFHGHHSGISGRMARQLVSPVGEQEAGAAISEQVAGTSVHRSSGQASWHDHAHAL